MQTAVFDDRQPHYAIVARAIEYIRVNARRQPSLADIAAAVNLSEHHLQRVFAAWAGISPKRFLQFLTKEHAKRALRRSSDVLGAALSAGLSSPGRLHDLMVSCEAMSPGEIKVCGEGLTIGYGISATPFGEALFGWTPRGVCYLAFFDDAPEERQRELASRWCAATLVRDDESARRLCERVFPTLPQPGKLHLVLRGTNFQIKVWEALLNTRPSQLISYGQLARILGSPDSPRAVGNAVGANIIGYLIPCHRVIRGTGDAGHYRWGDTRKAAMLGWEAARSSKKRVTQISGE